MSNSATPGSPSQIARAGWIVLLFVGAANFSNYVDRMLVSVVASQVKAEFHLTDTQYGLLSGLAFMAVYSAFTIVAGWIADRKPRHVIMAVSATLWGSATMAFGLATGFSTLLLARVGVALGQAGLVPCTYSTISDTYPAAKRAGALSVLNVAGLFGVMGSFMIGGSLAAHLGWRSAFLIAGAPNLLIAILIFLVIPDRRRSAVKDGVTSALSPSKSLKYLWHNRPYRWVVVGAGIGTFANVGLIQWLPLFFTRLHHLSLPQVSVILGPLQIGAMILATVVGGWLSNKIAQTSIARTLLICVWANVAIPPVFWLAFMVSSSNVALAMIFVGAFLGVVYGPTFVAASQNYCHVHVRATAAAVLVLMNGVIGSGLMSLLVGMLSDAGAVRFGDNSLRYALMLVLGLNLFAAWAFFQSYKSVVAAGDRLDVIER